MAERFAGLTKRQILSSLEGSKDLPMMIDSYKFPPEFQEWLEKLGEEHDFKIEDHLGGGKFGDAFLITYKGKPDCVLKLSSDYREEPCIKGILTKKKWKIDPVYPEIYEMGDIPTPGDLKYTGWSYQERVERVPTFWYIRKGYELVEFDEILEAFFDHYGKPLDEEGNGPEESNSQMMYFEWENVLSDWLQEEFYLADAHSGNMGLDPKTHHPVVFDPECDW